MNIELVEKIVNAVLYEGYILYPYRPTTTKNRQRFTFGRIYPRPFSQAQQGLERYAMQTECLVESDWWAGSAVLAVQVRFLQPAARDVGRFAEPLPGWPPEKETPFNLVPSLKSSGRLYQSWQEAVERQVVLEPVMLGQLLRQPQERLFSFPAAAVREPIWDEAGRVAGVILRRQEAVAGQVVLSAETIQDNLFKVTVRVQNLTPLTESQAAAGTEDETVILRTFASTHTILTVEQAAFVSLMNPPAAQARAAAACLNDGTWPVLVGDETAGRRDTLLSSPIILYDYPEIAAESPGDLFDGTEIDEILTLRIMTMTDEEKLEMSQVDEHARRILQRTEAMNGDHLMQMHGAIREVKSGAKESL